MRPINSNFHATSGYSPSHNNSLAQSNNFQGTVTHALHRQNSNTQSAPSTWSTGDNITNNTQIQQFLNSFNTSNTPSMPLQQYDADMHELIIDYIHSGAQDVDTYCATHPNIDPKTLSYWINELISSDTIEFLNNLDNPNWTLPTENAQKKRQHTHEEEQLVTENTSTFGAKKTPKNLKDSYHNRKPRKQINASANQQKATALACVESGLNPTEYCRQYPQVGITPHKLRRWIHTWMPFGDYSWQKSRNTLSASQLTIASTQVIKEYLENSDKLDAQHLILTGNLLHQEMS